MQPLLTVEEVAAILRCKPEAIYMQRTRGQKPGVLGFKVGKRVLFSPDTLTAYLAGLEADQAA